MGRVEDVDQIEMQEEEQYIIQPYFQNFFPEDNLWYKLVRFQDCYRLAHVEEQIAIIEGVLGIKPPLGYVEHMRRVRKRDKDIWWGKKLEGRLSPWEEGDNYSEEDEEEDDDDKMERGSEEEEDLRKYQDNIIFISQSNYMIKQEVSIRELDNLRRELYYREYYYK